MIFNHGWTRTNTDGAQRGKNLRRSDKGIHLQLFLSVSILVHPWLKQHSR